MSRTKLAEHIPLEKPLSIRLDINNYCNLKCEFCSTNAKHNKAYNMSYSMCKKVIDDICNTFGCVDTILFTSGGEPLLYPELCKIIEYTHSNHAVKTSKIITNGISLTNKMSDRLINAGLSYIQFSINGLSDKDYTDHCKVSISFDDLVDQISYFFRHRKNTAIHIKTINYLVKSQTAKEKFYDTFRPICDAISIEPLFAEDTENIDYKSFAGEEVMQYNNSVDSLSRNICHFPFFNMTITHDGYITPCCFKDRNYLANIRDDSLGDIWNEQLFNFQRKMLNGFMTASKECVNCTSFRLQMFKEDVIDAEAEICKERYDDIIKRNTM